MGTPGARAWVYARKSNLTTDQASITDQAEHGREACDEHGWMLAGVITEEVSASRFSRKNRERWEELLSHIRDGDVDVLVLWDSNRGGRELTDWSAFLDLCRKQSTRIYVVSHERLYDMANARDWETLAQDGVANQVYSEKLSAVIKRGKAAARRKGREAGQTPYGYRAHYDPRTGRTAGWLIDAREAKIVTEIVSSIARNIPVRVIERELNQRGIPARYGGKWNEKQIRYIARNPAYAGLVKQSDGSYKGRQQQKDGAEWPPIVDRSLWENAVTVLESRATGPRPGGARHLCTGLVQCECGGWLKIGHKGTLACPAGDQYIREEWLDEIVTYAICRRLSRDDARDLYAVSDDERITRLSSEIKTLKTRRDKFREMAAKGTIEPDALADIETQISPDITRKERELGTLRVVPALAGLIGADEVREAWDSMTVQARREVVVAVTGVVVRKAGRTATRAQREDVTRAVFDWEPQAPRKGPGGRPRNPSGT